MPNDSGASVRGEDSAAMSPTSPSISPHELAQLLALELSDPHSILGAHLVPQGVIVRAWRPDAARVEVVIEGESPRPMNRTHSAGLFELLVPQRTQLFPYLLRIEYPDGNNFTQRDPYVFLPTVSDYDQHLFGEGRHLNLYEKLGSHVRDLGDVRGVSFAVWAPGANGVSVVGSFNSWDGRQHPMRRLGGSGIWELFIPGIEPGALYKYEIRRRGGLPFLKTDPYALHSEVPPATSSIVYQSTYSFDDEEWMARRAAQDHLRAPLSIYEVHLGSWRRIPEEGNRSLTYRETAPALANYCREMGFTHIEFLPLKGHPYGGSWGYQVGNYYAPTARFGTPDDFRYLVDYLHRQGLGVIMDWVPAHFPKDAFALGRFDGTALYEHQDPRQGEHPDWGTYIFNYGRNEVKNFLIANALFWIKECHIDGLRVDAVASMLYLDYSRNDGRWVPNKYGGRENLEAIDFLKQLNAVIHDRHPGVMMIAEESTSWPHVSQPVERGGLGFDFKWNMGWMHDTIEYFKKDPIHRRYFHNNLTFGLVYAWSEHFILPFSHDEVVHMKGSMLNKMAGDRWQKFANLRALYAYMWAHPGKKLLFMGGEIGQWREWNDNQSIDWHLLDEAPHHGVNALVRDLNRVLAEEPALHEADVEPQGFEWIDADNAPANVLVFFRRAPSNGRLLVCACNFSPIARQQFRIGLPRPGDYRVLINTDAAHYGGSGNFTRDVFQTEEQSWNNQPHSVVIDLPPLATLWLAAPPGEVPSVTEETMTQDESANDTTTATPATEATSAVEATEATPAVEATAPKSKKPRRARKRPGA